MFTIRTNRYLQVDGVAEFEDKQRMRGRMLMIGKVVSFAVVKYTHSMQAQRTEHNPSPGRMRVEGEVVLVRVMIIDPPPQRVGNLYMCPKHRAHRRPQWVPANHLTSFLHVAPDCAGDTTMENLVTVARN